MQLNLKTIRAIITGKLERMINIWKGKGGTAKPGIVARRINNNILRELAKKVNTIIFITGTNGKTTISNLLVSILNESGKKVFSNYEGANLISGITTTFIRAAKITGKLDYEYAVIEVDEATMSKLVKEINDPSFIIVNNFFRDQLDRYGEIDVLVQKVADAIKETNARLVLNGDDPLTVRLNQLSNPKVFFGLSKHAHQFELQQITESKYCPSCKRELNYTHIHYGQLGYFECKCGFKRPDILYEAVSINGQKFTVSTVEYELGIKGIHNIYNALAVISVAKELGISEECIKKGLRSYKAINGRMQTISLNGIEHILNLVKNPVGLNISLSEVLETKEPKQVCLYLNDLDLDGTDISWIWDADLERLCREDIVGVWCSGTRAYDMALRMKYAGIDDVKITIRSSTEETVRLSVEKGIKTYHLPNYTALEPVRKSLTMIRGSY
ncbi:MurT ligase domain-containing protein [Bacillus sp. Marseille-P3661]|uniref:MurT ligase domain-containing protein n=1 Tax=Bacillus sp. Marseille-P3661 TaxID=1936234 RepID=UPI0015E183B8|nr:MurT ligase domain-containing protein [Bacillus sp. Marseille-P3661]